MSDIINIVEITPEALMHNCDLSARDAVRLADCLEKPVRSAERARIAEMIGQIASLEREIIEIRAKTDRLEKRNREVKEVIRIATPIARRLRKAGRLN